MRKLDLLDWCWEQEIEKPSHKMVLICLAQHYNVKTGQCNPSQQRIAKKTGLSLRTVNDAIRALKKLGLINADRRWTLQCSFLCSIREICVSNTRNLRISPDNGIPSREDLNQKEWNQRLRDLEDAEKLKGIED